MATVGKVEGKRGAQSCKTTRGSKFRDIPGPLVGSAEYQVGREGEPQKGTPERHSSGGDGEWGGGREWGGRPFEGTSWQHLADGRSSTWSLAFHVRKNSNRVPESLKSRAGTF